MNLQPVSALPAVFDLAETEIAEMSGEIKTLAKELKGIKKRIKEMAVFCDRPGKDGKIKKRSEVEIDSSPEEELLYRHRHHYAETQRETTRILEKMSQVTPGSEDVREFNSLMQVLRSMNRESTMHLQDMRKLMLDLRSRESDLEGRLINIVQERARLVSRMLEHNDKMDIARKSTDMSSDAQLHERLAAKYGVPVDQVHNLIAAKQADAEVR